VNPGVFDEDEFARVEGINGVVGRGRHLQSVFFGHKRANSKTGSEGFGRRHLPGARRYGGVKGKEKAANPTRSHLPASKE